MSSTNFTTFFLLSQFWVLFILKYPFLNYATPNLKDFLRNQFYFIKLIFNTKN